jgi:hypothetical protein
MCGVYVNVLLQPTSRSSKSSVNSIFSNGSQSGFSTFSGVLQTALISFDLNTTIIFVERNIKNGS